MDKDIRQDGVLSILSILVQKEQDIILVLLLANYVALGNLFNISGFLFPHLSNGNEQSL